MRPFVAFVLAATALAGARVARTSAAEGQRFAAKSPYVPSLSAAPFLSLGYRELAADLLFVRMLGYFGGDASEGPVLASLAETIITLDPKFERAYDIAPIAITAAKRDVDNDVRLRAVAILERATREFPGAYRYPNLAGQIYLADLNTDDAAQQRRWAERGALLLESASRKPGAPPDAAMTAAILQTRFGRQQRAIDQIRELLLITTDGKSQQDLLRKLAELEGSDAAAISAELNEARNHFFHLWWTQRPMIPASMYVLVGPRSSGHFDLNDLAAGPDLVGTTAEQEPLEPIE